MTGGELYLNKRLKRNFKPLFVLLTAILMLMAMFCSAAAAPENAGPVFVVEVEGMITAGKLNFLIRQTGEAVKQEAQLFVIVLDTPGGLVDATIKINQTLMSAPLPVAVLVAPSGAIAASAGSFIVLSADIAEMCIRDRS